MKTEIQSRFEEPLDEFTEMVLNKFGDNVISIVLFGSVARGTQKETSDVDLLIIMKNLPKRLLDREEIAYDIILVIIRKYHIRVCPIFLEPKELSTKSISPLIYGILTGYNILYDPSGFWASFIEEIKPTILEKKPMYIEDKKRWEIAKII